MSCVIVLGCFRSGTSAVAGVCSHLGVMMGKRFDTPSKANPKGYFEDLDFKELHKDMQDGLCVAHAYTDLVERREEDFKLWGVKDPRLCLYLPELTCRLTTEHRLINVIRPLDEIAKSLQKQLGNDPEAWQHLMMHYWTAKHDNLANYEGPILNVKFNDLLSKTEHTVGRIAKFVNPIAHPELQIREAVEWIDGN